jgi:hypothetical protein
MKRHMNSIVKEPRGIIQMVGEGRDNTTEAQGHETQLRSGNLQTHQLLVYILGE